MSKEKMKMMKRLLLMAVVTLGVLLVLPPPNVPAQGTQEELREEFHKTYALSPSGRIALENIQGNVKIGVWDRNEVKVDAVKTAYTRELLNDAEIEIESSNDSLRIHTQYPYESLTFSNDGSRRYRNPATVEYTLTVPRNARLNSIELVNGDLLIEGAAGDINASSVNGHVTGHNLRGEVRMATVNGPVEATFDQLDESKSVSLGSVNGSVILIIPSDSNVTIKAGTVSGAITNDFGLPVRRGDYVGRELYGQLGRGGSRIKLGNVNGGINIRHASDGRSLSPATSLITVVSKSKVKTVTKDKDKDDDWDDDSDDDSDDANQEARRAARDAAREAARAQLEAQRAQREAQRAQVEAQRAAAQAQREAQRAAAQAQREATKAAAEAQREAAEAARAAQAEGEAAAREAQSAAVQAQREAAQVARETQREATRVATEAAREAARVAREEAQTAVRVYDTGGGGNYRLVERSNVNFDVEGTPRINVRTFDGSISIHGWDKPVVVATLIKRASSEQGLKGIRFNATKNGNQIEINATFDNNFAQKIAPNVTSTNASANLEIYVPRNVALRVTSGDGNLAMDGAGGEVELITDDGSIEVVDGRGRVIAKTDDGRIRIAKFDGAAEAITDDGRITLEGRFAQLSARTGDGTILLSVPSNFNATIEADAEKFVNESNLPVTEESPSSKRVRRWKIGSGGAVLVLHTGDGKIILRSTDER